MGDMINVKVKEETNMTHNLQHGQPYYSPLIDHHRGDIFDHMKPKVKEPLMADTINVKVKNEPNLDILQLSSIPGTSSDRYKDDGFDDVKPDVGGLLPSTLEGYTCSSNLSPLSTVNDSAAGTNIRNVSSFDSPLVSVSCVKNAAMEHCELHCNPMPIKSSNVLEKLPDREIQNSEIKMEDIDFHQLLQESLVSNNALNLSTGFTETKPVLSSESLSLEQTAMKKEFSLDDHLAMKDFEKSQQERNGFLSTTKCASDVDPALPEKPEYHLDIKPAYPNQLYEVNYGDGDGKDGDISSQQHGTLLRKIKAECTEDDDDAQTTGDVHIRQPCESIFSSDQNLEGHMKSIHKEKDQKKTKTSNGKGSADMTLNDFKNEDNNKPTKPDICHGSEMGHEKTVVESLNGPLITDNPHIHELSVAYEREGLLECIECCEKASLSVNWYSKASHQDEAGCLECHKCGKAFTFRRERDRTIRENEGITEKESRLKSTKVFHLHDASNIHKDERMDKPLALNLESHKLTEDSRRESETGGKQLNCKDGGGEKVNQAEGVNDCVKLYRGEKQYKYIKYGKTSTQHSEEKPFKYDECGKMFRTSSILNRHIKIHSGKKLFKCNECERMFSTNSNLNSHMKRHTGEKPFKCDECSKMFHASNSLNRHMRTHTGEKPFKCDECDRMFSTRYNLNRHMMRTHTREKPFKCLECDREFSLSSSLYSHVKQHTGKTPFKCDECGRICNTSNDLINHMRSHTGEKPFKCNECGKMFRTSRNLNSHMKRHRGKKPFKCDEGGKMFHTSSNLYSHMKRHTGETPFKCDECGKMFRTSNSLIRHVRIHTGEKPFKCDECNRMFSTRGNLYAHMRTHTGEKAFKCDECNRMFSTSYSLNRHMMRRHTREKPFKCLECDGEFSLSSSLYSHVKKHAGKESFKCDECGRICNTSNNLINHMRSHTREKPFKCDECYKMFRTRNSLNRHVRIHTRENPFKCDECGKMFRTSSNLYGHMRMHTGEKAFKCESAMGCLFQVVTSIDT